METHGRIRKKTMKTWLLVFVLKKQLFAKTSFPTFWGIYSFKILIGCKMVFGKPKTNPKTTNNQPLN